MSEYTGLYTFDVDNHRFIPVGQADGIIDCFKFNLEPKEPLIKDEKVRKAVRAWAGTDGADEKIYLGVYEDETIFSNKYGGSIAFAYRLPYEEGLYTIAELCGEEEE